MTASYVLYIGILLAICFLAYYADAKSSKCAKWCIIAVLTLISGLRGSSVGLDTNMYMSKFLLIADGRMDLAYGMETSFKYICLVLMKLFGSPTALLLIFALITHGCIIHRFWDFRKQSSFPVMVCCYYMTFFFTTMNTLRQFCAIAIVFFSTRQLSRHKYLRYLLGVLVALLFHKSAIIGAVLLATELVQWKTLPKKQKYFFAGIVLISPALCVYVFSQLLQYERYFSNVYVDIGVMNIVKLLIFAITSILIFGVYKKENYLANWGTGINNRDESLSLVCIAYLIGLCLLFLGYVFQFVDRIGWYFFLFECVYYGMIVKTNHKLNKLVFSSAIFFVTGWAFIYSLVHNSQGTMPYAFLGQ